ncbi:hypothetical protein DFQ26_001161 [Actinomortierella ambigua]|nr:hypothetical protein DFQ26_001161 [Actinomortierella ambigua]
MSTAQQDNVAPLPAAGAAYAKYKDKFYIAGGTVKSGIGVSSTTDQFFALDLSKPWDAASPAWIRLKEAPKKGFVGAAMSWDGKNFMTLPDNGTAAHQYSFDSLTWNESKASFRDPMLGAFPVTLGDSGTVLIAGGLTAAGDVRNQYDIYKFDTGENIMGQPLPVGVLPYRQGYKALWSSALKSAVFYGGYGLETLGQWVTLYNPTTNQWNMLNTTGDVTLTTFDHCMAISRSSFLDPGSVVDAGQLSTPIAIYQISLDSWVKMYNPSLAYRGPPPETGPPPSQPTTQEDNDQDEVGTLNIGAIAGGIAGAVTVVAFFGFLNRPQKTTTAALEWTRNTITMSMKKNSYLRYPEEEDFAHLSMQAAM